MGSAITIYASKKQAGWTDLAAPLNDAETAWCDENWTTIAEARKQILGVYTNSAGDRLAWLVHRKSPCDKDSNGFILYMR